MNNPHYIFFKNEVIRLRLLGMTNDYIARQITDDYCRKTGIDVQLMQHLIEIEVDKI